MLAHMHLNKSGRTGCRERGPMAKKERRVQGRLLGQNNRMQKSLCPSLLLPPPPVASKILNKASLGLLVMMGLVRYIGREAGNKRGSSNQWAGRLKIYTQYYLLIDVLINARQNSVKE
jgi:hypothetical protein